MGVERFEKIVSELEVKEWSVSPNFLTAEETRLLALECRLLWESGLFRPAKVGAGGSKELRPEIRTDRVMWLDPAIGSLMQQRFFSTIEDLRTSINRAFYMGLFSYEGHFAIYPPGAFYTRHLDNFHGARHRIVTVILYLNAEWEPADGGMLRLYMTEDEDAEFVDIEPRGGTLAVFVSERFPHEVLPSKKERMSITGWLRRRE